MIDFIIKGNEDVVNEISKEALIEIFDKKVDLNLIKFMIENQNDLEVTYDKKKNIYRFDFLDIKDIAAKHIEIDIVKTLIEKDKYLANVDLDLNNNRFICFDAIGGMGKIIDSDLSQAEKIELIKKFKEFQKEIKNLGFKFDIREDSCMMDLVHDNLSELTLDSLSKVLSMIEIHEYNNSACFMV